MPYLGDLTAITLTDEQGRPRHTELAWTDPIHVARSLSVPALEGLHEWLAEATRRVLESRRPEYTPKLPVGISILSGERPCHEQGLRSLMPPSQETDTPLSDDDRPPLPNFELRVLALFPLLARDRALGVLTLGMGPSMRRYLASDLALAEDLAGRAAIALDNARLYRNVQEADRHKNEFLSMLAHELRNPLAPIRNAIQILRKKAAKEPEDLMLHEMIDRQVHHLIRIVDDLLDLSRITRGKIHLQMENVDLAGVIARAVETSRPLIDARKHELSIVSPPQPIRVRGDEVRLAQVVSNLLNNAAKYTEEGGKIEVRTEDGEEMATIRVRDNGMGIPTEMLSSIFELFKQVDHSLDRAQGGLGIGLTLVHKLVEMHDGCVEAFSEGPNRGSEFVVHLPIWRLEPKPAEPEEMNNTAPESTSPAPRRRVLIVDDNADAARSLRMLMEIGGHETHLCYDGHSALSEAERFLPEVILLDIGLPGLDGLEVARRLRAMNLSPRPILVALTGYGQADDVRRSHEAGFDHHFVKPADPQELTALLAALQ